MPADKSTKDNPTQGKGAPAAEQPKDVVGGETEVSKVYESMAAGEASGLQAKEGHVVYRGIATNRVITKSDWQRAGVQDQDDAGWTSRNGYAFPLDQLTDEAQQVLREDGQFLFPESDSE